MILTAPNRLNNYKELEYTVFLAGTIDDGDSINWNSDVAKYIDDIGYVAFNPRRNNWNKKADSNEITEQINWELEHLEKADLIIMNILGDSKSPISLLELGLFARSGKLVVFCPKSYYRHNNVKTTCERYGIMLYSIEDYQENIEKIKDVIKNRKKYGNSN